METEQEEGKWRGEIKMFYLTSYCHIPLYAARKDFIEGQVNILLDCLTTVLVCAAVLHTLIVNILSY